MNSDTGASLLQREEPTGFEEHSRFELRSVTGARYTIVEEIRADAARAGPACGGARRYRTAYAGLPVVANDDGSFTIVDTHTRLVRLARD